jgi:SAM-dependent methyltransferase
MHGLWRKVGHHSSVSGPVVSNPASTEVTPEGHAAALALYRQRACVYDMELMPFEPLRYDAVAQLALQPGDTVLDVGCGTGLSFALLQQAIGPQGRIIGIEQCPDMLERAAQRAQTNSWNNVTLIQSPAAQADIPGVADAALLHFTHDIMRHPAALTHLLDHLRPGARIVATGLKWAEPWLWPVNMFVLSAALYSVSSLEGMAQPWTLLAELVDNLDVRPTLMGGAYMASGDVR